MSPVKSDFPVKETQAAVFDSSLRDPDKIRVQFLDICERSGYDRIFIGLREERLLLWLRMEEKLGRQTPHM